MSGNMSTSQSFTVLAREEGIFSPCMSMQLLSTASFLPRTVQVRVCLCLYAVIALSRSNSLEHITEGTMSSRLDATMAAAENCDCMYNIIWSNSGRAIVFLKCFFGNVDTGLLRCCRRRAMCGMKTAVPTFSASLTLAW